MTPPQPLPRWLPLHVMYSGVGIGGPLSWTRKSTYYCEDGLLPRYFLVCTNFSHFTGDPDFMLLDGKFGFFLLRFSHHLYLGDSSYYTRPRVRGLIITLA